MNMRKFLSILICLASAVLCTAAANSIYFVWDHPTGAYTPYIILLLVGGILINLFGSSTGCGARLYFVGVGAALLKSFILTLTASVVWHVVLLFRDTADFWRMWIVSAAVCTVSLNIIFWLGMILVYLMSFQMGVRHRVVGLLLGLVPIANIVMLFKIIRIADGELNFEVRRKKLNKQRKAEQICAVKYPILFVHGVFFRDFKHLNYWGRIPADLEENGARIFYGEQNSASSVMESGRELCERIKTIVEQTGCEKVNIIAHSKGGLDSRAAIALGAAPYVASLTTINTPHRGCLFADYLLSKAPAALKSKVAKGYNIAASGLGDKDPDFLAAVSDLTAERCKELDGVLDVPEGIYTRSVASKMDKPTGGKFPLNFTYLLANHFDGDCDGLVAVENARFGEDFTLLTPKHGRGISHGDMIDLNRENIPGFDVREFYVDIVSGLRRRGL